MPWHPIWYLPRDRPDPVKIKPGHHEFTLYKLHQQLFPFTLTHHWHHFTQNTSAVSQMGTLSRRICWSFICNNYCLYFTEHCPWNHEKNKLNALQANSVVQAELTLTYSMLALLQKIRCRSTCSSAWWMPQGILASRQIIACGACNSGHSKERVKFTEPRAKQWAQRW